MKCNGDRFTEELPSRLETGLRGREVWLRSFTLLGGARVDVRGEHDVVQIDVRMHDALQKLHIDGELSNQ